MQLKQIMLFNKGGIMLFFSKNLHNGDMWKISLVFLDYKAQRQTDSQSRCAFFDFCFGGSDFFIKGFIDS